MQALLRSVRLVALYIVVPSLALAAPAGFGDHSSIASALNAEYKGKVLIQRHFISGNKVSYDWSGNPVGHFSEGPWTTEAELRVKDIHVPDDATIVIDAERVFLIRDNMDHGFRDVSYVVVIPQKEQKYWEKVRRLEIRITSGDRGFDLQGAQEAFARIFLLPSEHLSEIAPDWWKFVLQRDEQNLPAVSTAPTPLVPKTDVARVGGEVHSPRGRSLPNPEYQELARLLRYQGTVVLLTCPPRISPA